MIYPVYFETRNGNKYIFDNSTRVVLSINDYNIEDSNIEKSTLTDEKILKKIRADYPKIPLFQEIDIYEHQKRMIEECDTTLKKSGIRQLILMVTEACNFRCKYCIYSEMYSYSRNHSSKIMDWETAKKAIDYYMKFNIKSLEYNPTFSPCVGFYGGEALLNWSLVVKTVKYVEKVYRKKFNNILYAITTNGSLLDSEKIDFMLKYNFFITISLDGYKENHDRNRVYISGKSTYNDIINNIALLINEYKERAKHSDLESMFQFTLTYDNEISIDKLIQCAADDPEFYSHYARMSKVRGISTDYYNNQLPESVLNQQIYKWIDRYINGETKNRFVEILYKQNVIIPAFNTQFYQNLLGGTCIPGDKIAVTPSGKIYICEKIDYQSSLGDINDGIDFALQKKYLKEYIDARKKHCYDCNLTNICNQCFSLCSDGDEQFYVNDPMCNKLRKNIAMLFSLYYTARENGVDLI